MRGAEIAMNLVDTKSRSDREQSFEHPADDEMLHVPVRHLSHGFARW
jgi:hypothetical protein